MLAFAVEFVECVFSGRGEKIVFNGTVPERSRAAAGRAVNEFRDNDFAEMQLRDISFRTGIDLTKQKLPSGPDYIYVGEARVAIARTRAIVSQWDDDKQRTSALALLRRLDSEAERGQEQLFRQAPRGRRATVLGRVLSLLADNHSAQPGPSASS